MPIYEYRCPKCGVFEVVQTMSAEDLQECPECGQKVKRLISRPAVIYNCSGFYCTDYSKDSSTATNKVSAKNKPAQEKKSSPESVSSKDHKTA